MKEAVSIIERLYHMKSGCRVVQVREDPIFPVENSRIVWDCLTMVMVRSEMRRSLEISVFCDALTAIRYTFRENWRIICFPEILHRVANDVILGPWMRFLCGNSRCRIFPLVRIEDVAVVTMLGQHRIIYFLEWLFSWRCLKAEQISRISRESARCHVEFLSIELCILTSQTNLVSAFGGPDRH